MTYDYIIIGSGFGGSVSAHRLTEKGYRVLVLEKGKRFGKADFPKDNRDLKRWMWKPSAGLHGIFQMSFFDHVTVMHGVGVGGGSLTYANTLPTPQTAFFESKSWAHLANWKQELAPHYATAKRMLGATRYPLVTYQDTIIEQIAKDIGREDHYGPTEVAVYFGEPGKKSADPYFDGQGPDRVGCTQCGACMTGCRVGAKNTLDQNYLYLAEKAGAVVMPEREVMAVRPKAGGGYRVETKPSITKGPDEVFEAANVIFSGGVMGTIPLLLKMKEDPKGLPKLSNRLGASVRTNSEALFGVVAPDLDGNMAEGIAITSILHTDDHSHIEPVRYGHGSDFFRWMVLPHAPGKNFVARLGGAVKQFAQRPGFVKRAYSIPREEFAEKTATLLFMRTLDGTLSLKFGRSALNGFTRQLVSVLDDPKDAPQAFMEDATDLARRFAEKVQGIAVSMVSETLFGSPSTAHILGGACMGRSASEGVIDAQHRVFGYDGLYVIDGSAVSANPGVNPSLTITALAERAMSFIAARGVGSAAAE